MSLTLLSLSLLSSSSSLRTAASSSLSRRFWASKSSALLALAAISTFLEEITLSRIGTIAAVSFTNLCWRSSVLSRDSRSRSSSTRRRSSATSGGRGWTWAEERGKYREKEALAEALLPEAREGSGCLIGVSFLGDF